MIKPLLSDEIEKYNACCKNCINKKKCENFKREDWVCAHWKLSPIPIKDELKVGDKVYFKRLVNGKYQGLEKTPYIVIETDLKFGEVDILVKNIKTNEKVYTNTRALEKTEEEILIQVSLFDYF